MLLSVLFRFMAVLEMSNYGLSPLVLIYIFDKVLFFQSLYGIIDFIFKMFPWNSVFRVKPGKYCLVSYTIGFLKNVFGH